MTLTVSETLMKAWCLCAVVLFLKMFANSLVQGYGRIGNRHFVNPEDAKAFARGKEAQDAPHPLVARGAACWRNDLENIPIFLLLSLVGVLLTPAQDSGELWMAAMGCFVVARIGHTISYIKALQPWRTLSFSLGVFATFTVCGLLVMRALSL